MVQFGHNNLVAKDHAEMQAPLLEHVDSLERFVAEGSTPSAKQ